MLAKSVRSARWLLVGMVGLAGALAPHFAERPRPLATPEVICVIPDVELAQRYAAPAPNPPAPVPDRRVVVADLLSLGSPMPNCGSFVFETAMVFTDVAADSATLRVLVPCAEMPRRQYSPTAGNAPRLREHVRYRLELSGPVANDTAGKDDSLWRADRIHVAQDPVRQRPAIADMMCRNVWGPSCRKAR